MLPEIIKECNENLKLAIEAETQNRAQALSDLKFSAGDQWPAFIQVQRELEHRPCLTINKTDAFIRQVVNEMRQQRPQVTAHPVSGGANKKKAEIIEGLLRHIQVNSGADVAYDTAADFQVRMGWGYFRLMARYVREDSFDQELYIERVRNPFSVYFDPNSIAPAGEDAQFCIISELIDKKKFQRKYPKAKWVDFRQLGDGDDKHIWATEKEARIAEYYVIDKVKDTLCMLSNGRTEYKSQIDYDLLQQLGVTIASERETVRRQLKWYKMTALEVLEERELPGRFIPVFPVYGAEYDIEGKVIRYGMVRALQDPQRMYNFWRTAETEVVALAPKAPWLVAEGQIEGYEDVWNAANQKSYAYLPYKPVNTDTGQALPPPMRLPPQGMPAAQINAAMGASEDMKAVAGMFDPALGANGTETSGIMVQRRQRQSDMSNFHFYDNFCRTLKHLGRVILELLPHYYDTERIIRIIGVDGMPSTVTINKKVSDEMGVIKEIENDVTTGEYDIVIDTGPGYQTKRQDAADHMLQALATPLGQQIAATASDVVMRQFDWPGADQIADRLAATNPIAMAEKKMPDNVPDEAKAVISNLLAQNQQLQQQLQAAQVEQKYKLDLEKMKIEGRMQEVEITDATKREDMRSRDTTELQKQAMQSQTALILADMEGAIESNKVAAAMKRSAQS